MVDAEQIIVMDHGRIIERGSHAALLGAKGAYAHMWERQQTGVDQANFSSPALKGSPSEKDIVLSPIEQHPDLR